MIFVLSGHKFHNFCLLSVSNGAVLFQKLFFHFVILRNNQILAVPKNNACGLLPVRTAITMCKTDGLMPLLPFKTYPHSGAWESHNCLSFFNSFSMFPLKRQPPTHLKSPSLHPFFFLHPYTSTPLQPLSLSLFLPLSFSLCAWHQRLTKLAA